MLLRIGSCVMAGGRFWMTMIFAFALTACAGAPSRQTGTLNVPAPANMAAPTSSYVSAPLEVCPGMRVSNAPTADANRRLVGYEPYSRVQDVTLARAPVEACVSSGFGPRYGGAGSHHNGVDLYTRNPAPVYAGGDGVVEYVGLMRGFGRTVVIRHNYSVKTRYGHLSSFAAGLRPGMRIARGQLIGQTGRTGNATAVHLHYEVLIDGRPRDPLGLGG